MWTTKEALEKKKKKTHLQEWVMSMQCIHGYTVYEKRMYVCLYWLRSTDYVQMCEILWNKYSFTEHTTHMRSGRNRWMMAQKARPLFHDDVMLVTLTSRYPSAWRWHHMRSPFTLAAMVTPAATHQDQRATPHTAGKINQINTEWIL